MTSDKRKQNLKELHEEQLHTLNAYEQHDIIEYPGWTFLLSDVVDGYGICPFLNVDDEVSIQRRIPWLESQADKGELYYNCVKEHTDVQTLTRMQQEIELLKESLIVHVKERMSTLSAEDDVLSYAEIVSNIKAKKESRSQNKKTKDAWMKTLKTLEFIMLNLGVDFTKYSERILGYALRYTPPQIPSCQIDETFLSLCDQISHLEESIKTKKRKIEKAVFEAQRHLNTLIACSFQLTQTGRYFKRWALLSPEKKEERIKSYCDWKIRETNESVATADLMKEFILQKLATKELRPADVVWSTKLGVITFINIIDNHTQDLLFNELDENDIPNHERDAESRFSVGEKTTKPIRRKNHVTKKKREELFKKLEDTPMLQHANRLILFELVQGIPDKEEIVKSVLRNLTSSNDLTKQLLLDYVSSRYDQMLKLIKENVPDSSE